MQTEITRNFIPDNVRYIGFTYYPDRPGKYKQIFSVHLFNIEKKELAYFIPDLFDVCPEPMNYFLDRPRIWAPQYLQNADLREFWPNSNKLYSDGEIK